MSVPDEPELEDVFITDSANGIQLSHVKKALADAGALLGYALVVPSLHALFQVSAHDLLTGEARFVLPVPAAIQQVWSHSFTADAWCVGTWPSAKGQMTRRTWCWKGHCVTTSSKCVKSSTHSLAFAEVHVLPCWVGCLLLLAAVSKLSTVARECSLQGSCKYDCSCGLPHPHKLGGATAANKVYKLICIAFSCLPNFT